MGVSMVTKLHLTFLLVNVVLCSVYNARGEGHNSAVGDPGMRRDGLRVAFEGWNFCNEVGLQTSSMGSPRAADCFDLLAASNHIHTRTESENEIFHFKFSSILTFDDLLWAGFGLKHKVSEAVNKLGVGNPFDGLDPEAVNNPDLYAVEKEKYLGSLCQVADNPNPWHFWMVMLKNGNYDTTSGFCPRNGKKIPPFVSPGRFPCFGRGCMGQPKLYLLNTFISPTMHVESQQLHQPCTWTELLGDGTMKGSFNGTYDSGADVIGAGIDGISFYEVVWEKKIGAGSWVFRHKLKTSKNYPWLMLYLRADATKGFSGGYHYDTRGMLKVLPESPNFKVRMTLDVIQGGGPKSQFYLIDIGSCWKNNGKPCDGDVVTDITRYSEMIINPETPSWCNPTNLKNCPPYHITPNNTKIYRNDTANFPYGAYHYYCAPENAQVLEKPVSTCDPYSNPQAQELVQLLPHPIWAEYGYPTKQGDGWVGDARTWELDVGGVSSRLYFYQDPGTPPARRIWTSIDMGTEIFVSNKDEQAEWTLSDFDVILI